MHNVKIIADSISSETGQRITTFELEYPRIIHSEFLTHRVFSRNASSSRAIPVEKQIEQIEKNPFIPSYWGKNQAGMQANEECSSPVLYKHPSYETTNREEMCYTRNVAWKTACQSAVTWAKAFKVAEYHKQIVNRLLEPFSHIKVVVTATDWNNFFELRCHKDAQPEIKILADLMKEAMEQSEPQKLEIGDWHVPYWKNGFWLPTMETSLEEAQKVSASCCAQVSYRKNDDSIEKALAVYDRLVGGEPLHASPFEHQATPIKRNFEINDVKSTKGITALNVLYKFEGEVEFEPSSGNFRNWIQYRQLL